MLAMETKDIWHKVEAEENQGRILWDKITNFPFKIKKSILGQKNTRFSLFTNYTNLPQTDFLNVAPYEQIDIYDVSLGYTAHSSSSSLT